MNLVEFYDHPRGFTNIATARLSCRVLGVLIQIKGPGDAPFFSEREGYRRPILKACGWRLFVGNKLHAPFAEQWSPEDRAKMQARNAPPLEINKIRERP